MERLSLISELVVRQQKEWGEILTGFEGRNSYEVSDSSGNRLYLAVEEKGSILSRWFLKAYRPFTIELLTEENQLILWIARPFRFFFHCAEVVNFRGQVIGTIKRRFSILSRTYSVFDSSGEEVFQLIAPLIHPWTFRGIRDGIEYGRITKRWSGLLKESFTDADNFSVAFPEILDIKLKSLFLGAVFLIDFVHFENRTS